VETTVTNRLMTEGQTDDRGTDFRQRGKRYLIFFSASMTKNRKALVINFWIGSTKTV